ncbi:MAG: methyltransferase [Aquificae bacterium]|nr:methyltransferase [Aquificota bacterium]
MAKVKKVRFRGLTFLQGSFKISSDNALFFDFVRLPKRGLVVELGAGFGLGTVLLAKRHPGVRILAVEYQPELAELLRENLRLNRVENAEVLPCDVRRIEECLPQQVADAVYSNPPFWRAEFLKNSKKDPVFVKANYEVETKLEDFVRAAKYLLKSSKSFFLMFETPRLFETLLLLREQKFAPKRMRFVYPREGKPSHAFFVESVLGGKGGFLKVEEPVFSNSLKKKEDSA